MNVKESMTALVKDLLGVALLLVFLLLFFNIERIKDTTTLPDSLVNVNTIFISIIIEAFPFILLGVFVSALIQIYVSEDTIQKYLPKNAIAALFPAAVLGAIFPICECAIVPVVRRLIKKGMPLHVGVVFLVGAPILNPVVFASTYYAFRNNPSVLYSRMGLAFILAIIIGAVIYFLFRKNNDQLKWSKEELLGKQVSNVITPTKKTNRIKQTMYHAADEFFMMGKYLIAGAFIAALFQTFLDRSILQALGSNEYSSTFVMMAFAYVLSLCSEADAFVAASFSNNFTTSSIIAFLVYGPMIDLKNTIMLLAFFKIKFVLAFITTVTVFVFGSVLLLHFFIL
ncbi:hypothetical protein BKP45_09955 [Anaerobacillus alkalidiazotrophicus]|uniref:Permease n=1 Tax=Anaerobacillus alkalidiazotrophicus TaxID=472963 RepID=A0A1S2M6N9_9BACI|nr:permease [Anaerobacillus alkalidiazotrophicus]OIJ20371.1 hypothetical protein BKP45_09955 [Anaerobacillus alkalidiazotrophicus]